jgi:hypothetical protein
VAVCAIQGSSGLELVPVQPGAACAGVVLLEPADIPPNPFFLSNADALAYSGAVAGVWIAAWCFRMFIAALRSDEGKD